MSEEYKYIENQYASRPRSKRRRGSGGSGGTGNTTVVNLQGVGLLDYVTESDMFNYLNDNNYLTDVQADGRYISHKLAINAADFPFNQIGIGQTVSGWVYDNGPALSFGDSRYVAQIQADPVNGRMKLRTRPNGEPSDWVEIWTSKSLNVNDYLSLAEFATYFKKDAQGRIYTEVDFYSKKSVSAYGASGSSGSGGLTSIGDLVDVDDAGKQSGSILMFNGTHWVVTDGSEITPDLTGYASESWVEAQGFLKAAHLAGYAKETWVNSQGFLKSSNLSGYATQSWVSTQLGSYLPVAGGTISGNLVAMGSISSGGNIVTNGLLSTTANGCTLNIGATSANYVHFNTSPARTFYFNAGAVFNGTVAPNEITIKSTGAVEHLKFSAPINYITAPTGGIFSFIPNGKSLGVGNSPLLIGSGYIYPGEPSAYSCGTALYRWSNVYSVSGNFSGTMYVAGTLSVDANITVGGILYTNSIRGNYSGATSDVMNCSASQTNLGQTVGTTYLRSGNANLIHIKNGTNYTVWDASNLVGNQAGHYHNYISNIDSRDVAATPEEHAAGVYLDFKSNANAGLSDGGAYTGILTVRKYGSKTDWSGGKVAQLGFTDIGNMWLRSGSGTSWSAWGMVWNSNNFNPDLKVNYSGGIGASAWPDRIMGYGYEAHGWITTGPAVSFGSGAYVFQMQNEVGQSEKLYVRSVYNGTPAPWYTIFNSGNSNLSTVDWTVKNLISHGTMSTNGINSPFEAGSYLHNSAIRVGNINVNAGWCSPILSWSSAILGSGYVSKMSIGAYRPAGTFGRMYFAIGTNDAGTSSITHYMDSIGIFATGTLHASTDVIADNGYLKSVSNGCTLAIGSQNTSWVHFSNNASRAFHFNNNIAVQGSVYSYVNEVGYCGLPANRWANVYSVTGNFSGSVSVAGNVTATFYTFANGNKMGSNDSNYIGFFTSGGSAMALAALGITLSDGYVDVSKRPAYGIYSKGEILSASNIKASGSVTARTASDVRLKENFRPVGNALSTINKLTPFFYTWRREAFDLDAGLPNGYDIGLSAQQVKEHLPAASVSMWNEYLGIDYSKITPLIIAGMQEFSSWKDEKDREIERLRERVQVLESQLKAA